LVLHCGQATCEADIKARTGATPRIVPLSGAPETGTCIRCGDPSSYGTRVIFGRAY
jgi:prolyl-tRNA synthetase